MTSRIRRALDEKDQGFTLIEVLVVIIVIGVIAGIAIPLYLNQRKKAVDAGLKADAKSFATAEMSWIADNPGSPAGTGDYAALVANGFKKTPGNGIAMGLADTLGGYCIIVWNAGSTAGGTAGYITYDSLGGGLLNNGNAWHWWWWPPGGVACTPGAFPGWYWYG